MKTTIEMPDELFRRAKTTAVARGQTLKQLVTDALERELAEPVTVQESTEERAAKVAAFVRELEALAEEVSAEWKSDLDAVGAVREQRRF